MRNVNGILASINQSVITQYINSENTKPVNINDFMYNTYYSPASTSAAHFPCLPLPTSNMQLGRYIASNEYYNRNQRNTTGRRKTTKHKMIEVESNILDSIIWLSTVYSVRITAVHASSPVVY